MEDICQVPGHPDSSQTEASASRGSTEAKERKGALGDRTMRLPVTSPKSFSENLGLRRRQVVTSERTGQIQMSLASAKIELWSTVLGYFA
jgi:hypothetical protein